MDFQYTINLINGFFKNFLNCYWGPFMKLREKTLILIGMTVAFSIMIMYFASTVSLIDGFENLERQNTMKNVELATNSISNEISDMNGLIYDWAVWDDTYKFIQDNNSAYIHSNLVDSTYSNLKLNFIIFIDKSGNIVYANGFNLENNEYEPLPAGINNYLAEGSILLDQNKSKGVSGIIQLSEGPALISAHPILTTNEKGPARGTLIFGRMLDESMIQKISGKTQLSITVSSLNSSIMASDFQKALKSINETSPVYINPLNNNFIAGYVLVNDIYGKPAFILKVENDRGFFNEYKNGLSFYLLSLVIVGCVLAIGTLIYLDKSVLSRLSRLDKDITNIGKKGSISSRLSIEGEDELSSLATSINTMLSKLETSQQKFKESELKFRSIVQLASDGIILADRKGNIIFWNRGAQLMFGYDEEELLGKPISILLHDEYRNLHQKALDYPDKINSEHIDKNYESFGHKKDGTNFHLEISHTSWKIKGEKYYCAILRDITDRKHAEDEIKKSLSEKEAMLKEIHHRVKNNMQIISSLLSLQCRYIKDKEAFDVFKESQNRVKSMALVHEKLYQSEGLAEIDFTEYIKNLVSELFRSYGTNINNVHLDIDAEKIFLDTDTAIPCGLIINELVSNSLKYAFKEVESSKPENKKFSNGNWKIYIKLHNYNDKILLIIGDNGKGLPEGFDLENTETLGLRLVKTLVHQLNGNLKLINKDGVEFKITF